MHPAPDTGEVASRENNQHFDVKRDSKGDDAKMMKLKDARVTATDLEPFGTGFWTCVCVGNQGSLRFSKVCTFSHADLLGAFDIKSELCYANCRAMIGKFVFNAYTSPERHGQLWLRWLHLEERERGVSDKSRVAHEYE